MFRSLARAVAVTVTVAALLVTAAAPGAAAAPGPVGAPSGADPSAVSAWPAELQQLVAGTPEFTSAPWFTDGQCTDRGGDVGEYVNTFFQREAAFRQQLTSDLVSTVPELQGTGAQAQTPGEDEVFPNGNTAYDMPVGVCAADLQAWGTPDASSPWGFTWAQRPDATSLRRMSTAGGADPVNPLTVCTDDPGSYLCSRAMFVDCDRADTAGKQRCLDWNFSVQQHLDGMSYWAEQNKSVADRVGDFFGAVGQGLWSAGAWVVDGLGWVLGKVGDAVGWVAKKGMEQVVAFFTSGAVWLWGQVTAWMVNSTTPNLSGGGYAATYNLISGVMLAMAFLIWLAGLATAWRRGRLTGSVLGAVKAIVGIQIVGIIAFLMLQLANQATLGLISGQQAQIADSDFTVSLLQVNPVVGLVAAVLTILGLIGAGLVLIFQAPVTLGHALFGTVAAAGQAHHSTSHWMGRWFITLLSLCWCKFFMVGMTILAQNLLTSTTANVTQNFGQQLFSVLAGMLLMLLLPTTPWLLRGVMSFTVGHASAAADRMAAGITTAVGTAAAGAAAGPALSAAGAVAGAGAESMHALATMGSNSAALGALNNGTFGATPGGAGGGGAGTGAGGDGTGGGAGGASTGNTLAVPQGGPGTPGTGDDGNSEPAGGNGSGNNDNPPVATDGTDEPAADSGSAPGTSAGTGSATGSGGGTPSSGSTGRSGGPGEPPPDPQDEDRQAPEDLQTATPAVGRGTVPRPPGARRAAGSRNGGRPGGVPAAVSSAATGSATGASSLPGSGNGSAATHPGSAGPAAHAGAADPGSAGGAGSTTSAAPAGATADQGSAPAPAGVSAPEPAAAGSVMTAPTSAQPATSATSATSAQPAPSADDGSSAAPPIAAPPVAAPPVSEPPRPAAEPPVAPKPVVQKPVVQKPISSSTRPRPA